MPPRSCQDRHGHAHGLCRASPSPVASDLLSPSPLSHALHTSPSTSQTPPFPRPSPVAVVIVDVLCHGTARTTTSPHAPVPLLLRPDSRRDRLDVTNTMRPLPRPLTTSRAVVTTHLPRAPRPPLAAIKGGRPSLQSSNHLAPLLPLALHDHFPSSIEPSVAGISSELPRQ